MRILATILVVLFSFSASANDDKSILGFSAEEASEQFALEARFDELYSTENVAEWMEFMSARPHHAGSPYGKEVAEFIAAKFTEFGYDTEIETYYVLMPTPKLRLLEVVSPEPYTARLQEPQYDIDPVSKQVDEQLPTYNAFSPDGDVTAEVVYVNRGLPADYEELERRGISVEGKIVLARYYGSWRGIKPKVAEEHGAIGTLIFTDPIDDGYVRGAEYPSGEFKSEHMVQRGSVLDLPLRVGDPLTPGYGATKNAKRIKREDADNLIGIPTLPISWGDALPILRQLGGDVVPDEWKGGLPITYRTGPGPVVVHLKLEFNWDLTPVYNIIARMEGATTPDQWVMRGNHHDAWVNGAVDPVSGMASLMEEARVVAELAKEGHPPARTILYAGWDAEEPALLASTEWVEDHRKELDEHLVAYINTDATLRGFLFAGGSHSLEAMFSEITFEVIDPETGVTVAERYRAWRIMNGDAKQKEAALNDPTTPLYAMGSGSDYTAFFHHLGIASFNLGFGGEDEYATYHSIYDSFYYYTTMIDPGFDYVTALGKTTGRTTLRLANAEILPFEFTRFAKTLNGYGDEVIALANSLREEAKDHNRLVKENIFQLTTDPRKPVAEPRTKPEVPHFNFAPMQNALKKLEKSAKKFAKALNSNDGLSARDTEKLNRLLYTAERLLVRKEGLPKRPWYRNHIYAPGFYTGYGVKTFPGVREALEQSEYQEVDKQILILAGVINDYASQIDEAAKIVNK
ncbi:MAG: transferrin receptor-like dimerization domain-containing protein [Alphaproteobacteria bacterium]